MSELLKKHEEEIIEEGIELRKHLWEDKWTNLTVIFAKNTLPSSDEIYWYSEFGLDGDLTRKAIHAFRISGSYMGTVGANIPTHLEISITKRDLDFFWNIYFK